MAWFGRKSGHRTQYIQRDTVVHSYGEQRERHVRKAQSGSLINGGLPLRLLMRVFLPLLAWAKRQFTPGVQQPLEVGDATQASKLGE